MIPTLTKTLEEKTIMTRRLNHRPSLSIDTQDNTDACSRKTAFLEYIRHGETH